MLKQRVFTAVALILLMLAVLFRLSPAGVAIILGVFGLVAGWEWAALSGFRTVRHRLIYVVCLGLTGMALYYVPVLPVLIVSVLWWLWAWYELMRYNDIRQGIFESIRGRALSGFFILLPAWCAAIYLHATDPRSPAALLFLFLLVWVADSTAFFAGRFFGRVKLAPRLSPGKSVEGLLGGILGVLILAYLCGVLIWKFSNLKLIGWLVIAVVATLFSVLGDLIESKAKRIAGVKDSGAILPGHGGIFDRIDAFTAAAPVFALGSVWLLRLVR